MTDTTKPLDLIKVVLDEYRAIVPFGWSDRITEMFGCPVIPAALRAAVVADLPELDQSRAETCELRKVLAQREFEQCCAEYSDEARKAGEERDAVRAELAQALRERDGLSAMVEELEAERGTMAGELAKASERIAALEDMWTAATAAMDQFLTERDAALARVRELEAMQAEILGVLSVFDRFMADPAPRPPDSFPTAVAKLRVELGEVLCKHRSDQMDSTGPKDG